MLKCGIFESDITPMLGMGIPGYFEERYGTGVKERLCCEVVYFEDGDQKVVLISTDALAMFTDTHDAIRQQIATRLQIPISCIMSSCIHTHTGGPIRKKLHSNTLANYDPEYAEFVIRRIVECAVMAVQEAREVHIRFARGTEDKLGYCRIYRHPDGTLRTWRRTTEPYTAIDSEVGVLRIELPDGTPYGVIVNYACHCDCVGGTEYSADYVGIMRQTLRRSFGDSFHPVFFSGFCGNINHVDLDDAFKQPLHYQRMGRMLAADVLRIWELADQDFTDTCVRAEVADVTIPARLPDAEMIAWAKEVAQNSDAIAKDRVFANTILTEENWENTEWTVSVQVVRVGQLAFYAMPGEMFTEFGKMLKEASPLPYVMPIYLANGAMDYVPVREVFGYGDLVYEARVGSGFLGKEGGYMMVDKALELANRMVKE